MKLHLRVLAPALLSLAAFGCSGDDQEEKPEEPAATDGGEEPAAPDAEAPAEEPAPAPEAAPAPAPEPPPAAPAPAPAAAEPAGFDGAKVTRYVNTYAVNVRSAPDKTAPVLRHHKWGDKLEVVVNGEWAKLNTGEYLSAKVLVENPPEASKPAKGKGKGKAKPKAKAKKGK